MPAVDDNHGLSDFVAGLDEIEEEADAALLAAEAAALSAAAAEAEAATKSTVSAEGSSSNPTSLSTSEGEVVVVVVKGAAKITTPGGSLALNYDGSAIDTLTSVGDPSEDIIVPFTLTWVGGPGAAMADLEVVVTEGTIVLSDVLFTIIRIT